MIPAWWPVPDHPYRCDCWAMACHPEHGELMVLVHMHSRTGGKGTLTWLSKECRRRREGEFTIVDPQPTVV